MQNRIQLLVHLQPLPIELGLLSGERRFTGLVSQGRVAQLRLVRFKVALFFAQALCQFIVLFCKTKSAVGRAVPCVCARAGNCAHVDLKPSQNALKPSQPLSK